MKLIGGSVGPAQQQDDRGREHSAGLKHGVDNGAIEQHREDRVFRNMPGLPNEKFRPN